MSVTQRLWPLAALACLTLTGDAHAQTPAQLGRDPMGVLRALETATDARSAAVRRQIEAGPADLVRARAEIAQDGVALDQASLQRPLPPPDQNAAPLYQKLFQLLRDKPLNLPIYAQPLTADHTYTPAQLPPSKKSTIAAPMCGRWCIRPPTGLSASSRAIGPRASGRCSRNSSRCARPSAC